MSIFDTSPEAYDNSPELAGMQEIQRRLTEVIAIVVEDIDTEPQRIAAQAVLQAFGHKLDSREGLAEYQQTIASVKGQK